MDDFNEVRDGELAEYADAGLQGQGVTVEMMRRLKVALFASQDRLILGLQGCLSRRTPV